MLPYLVLVWGWIALLGVGGWIADVWMRRHD